MPTIMEVLHGALVNVAGTGVLLIGEPGAGKSFLALSLVAAGNQLVADDVIEVTREEGALMGRAPRRFAGLLEVRGLGIVDIRKLYDVDSYRQFSQIDLCVEFLTGEAGQSSSEIDILGIKIPRFSILANDQRDRRILIETVVKALREPDMICDPAPESYFALEGNAKSPNYAEKEDR